MNVSDVSLRQLSLVMVMIYDTCQELSQKKLERNGSSSWQKHRPITRVTCDEMTFCSSLTSSVLRILRYLITRIYMFLDFFSCVPLIHHHNVWDNFFDFLSRSEYLNIIWVRPIFNKYQERVLLEFLVDNFNSNSVEFFVCNRFEEAAKYVRVVLIASDTNTGLD